MELQHTGFNLTILTLYTLHLILTTTIVRMVWHRAEIPGLAKNSLWSNQLCPVLANMLVHHGVVRETQVSFRKKDPVRIELY